MLPASAKDRSRAGSDERTRSAQVTVRIPAKYFDEARTQVRRIAKTVEQDTIEARDVTREYVDQEASLRNARAEEAQYLAILKRAAAVKDVLEVSSKLAEVRGRIDESEADLHFLHHQVEMSLLTTNISAVAQAQVFGVHWRPLYEAKLSLRGALVGMADYADAMVALFLNLPVLVDMGLHNRGAAKGRLDGAAAYRAGVFSWTYDMAAPSAEVAGSIVCNGNLHNSWLVGLPDM